MKFEDNLRELRKQNGYSQEGLAELLNVSRQAVSKWENGSGYPELDKLMALCELFHCTLDDLLHGDIKERDMLGKQRYDQHCNQMSKAIAFGVFMCISAVTSGAFMETLFVGDNELILGAVFFIFATIGVLTFIYFGIQSDTYHRKYPNVPQDIYTETEIDAFEKSFQLAMVIGVGLLLVGVILQQLIDYFMPEFIANGCFMFVVSIAVSIFVYWGMMKSKYDDTLKHSKPIEKEKEHKQADKWCGVIMMIATIIFLVWGWVFDSWKICWIVYPVGGIICGIIYTLLPSDENKN